jgi:hypothetical protein
MTHTGCTFNDEPACKLALKHAWHRFEHVVPAHTSAASLQLKISQPHLQSSLKLSHPYNDELSVMPFMVTGTVPGQGADIKEEATQQQKVKAL